MWSAIGSAVGLGSIWRFPYVVGQSGGAAFVFLFCIFLFFISLPVLIAEIVIGRSAVSSPYGAFRKLGKNRVWGGIGLLTIITGFLVSSFYSVVCGWTLGYLIEAIGNGLTKFESIAASRAYFDGLVGSPIWAVGTHLGFMILSTVILLVGVQKGIERGNKIFMPLLFLILILLVIKGLSMSGAEAGLKFLFTPKWSQLTPAVIIMALGQAFFALSIGQGTMVTYGSYLSQKDSIPNACMPVALAVILVSLFAGVAIFTVVFSVGAQPTDGTNLMFQTLPLVFSELPAGYFLSILFFLLIFLAGLTSQISAMEPLISYLIDEKKFPRHKAVFWTGLGAFILGIPSALSFGVWKETHFFDIISYICINILIPLGGLAAVLLVGWRWGLDAAFTHLREGAGGIYIRSNAIPAYLRFSIKFLAPVIIIIILLNLLGLV